MKLIFLMYNEDGEIERYNRFKATMLIRHSADGKKYLYDILDIKKKRATLSAHYELTRHKTHFSLTET